MDKDYQTVLLEQIRDQNKAILEGQKDQASRADITELRQDIAELKADVKMIKAAVKDVSRDLNAHKGNTRLHLSPGGAFGRHAA